MDKLNKSILALTNILKDRPRPGEWYKRGKKYSSTNYNYPRTNPPGGTYNEEDSWALANHDGRFKGGGSGKGRKTNTAWDKAAAAIWAKQNRSGITPGYQRERGKKPTKVLANNKVKLLTGTGFKQTKNAAKTRDNKY